MIHCNGHKICAIDTETTGLDFKLNDIIDIAIIPLDYNLDPDPDYPPFWLELQPAKDVKHIDFGYVRKAAVEHAWQHGMNPIAAGDLFIEWVKRLDLPERKRIMPLAQNWPFDRDFIREWLGDASFNLYFDGHYRDLLPVSLFVNDGDDFHNERYHFPKHRLSYVCSQLGIQCDDGLFHTAQYDAVKTAEAYKKLCQGTKCLL